MAAEHREAFPAELVARLDAVPFQVKDTRRDPGHYWRTVKSAIDFVAHNTPPWHKALVRLNPYPPPWAAHQVPVADDGTFLAAWFGRGAKGAPAVLYAPGTFHVKDDTQRKSRAIRTWRRLGYHVLVVDLRGFGGSYASYGSGGFLEAQDLHRAADFLKDLAGVDRVALMGDSLGGASALLASGLPEAAERFSCTLAWSPFTDYLAQARYSSTNPGRGHPFFIPFHFYRLMVQARTGRQARDFHEFMEQRAVDLGFSLEELARLSSAANFAGSVRVPTLVHHAVDDPIVPVDHAYLYAKAAAANPNVRVRILDGGGHADFDAAAPDWFWETVRTFVAHHAAAPHDKTEVTDA